MKELKAKLLSPWWAQCPEVRAIAETNDALRVADEAAQREFFRNWGEKQEQEFLGDKGD